MKLTDKFKKTYILTTLEVEVLESTIQFCKSVLNTIKEVKNRIINDIQQK